VAERSDPRSTPPLPTPAEWRRVLERLAELEKEVERLRRENEWLRRELEKALRAAKRQAAPFSRQAVQEHPRKPGRKAGSGYGRAHWRPIPEPVEETLEAPLPPHCPHCGGAVEVERIAEQYQTELPPIRPRHLRIRVEVGRCRQCGKRLQGRHPQQTSDALGVAASQLGPQAVAGAVWLVKGLGLSHEKARAVLEQWGGLSVSRSGLCRAIARAGRKAEPTYQHLVQIVRRSPVVSPDETGWKVAGRLWWAWVFATSEVTVYAIQPGRGFPEAAAVLGPEFGGLLVHDGWRVYEQFRRAEHQTCLAHLLRRCREMIQMASPAAARFPRRVQEILEDSLQLRRRRAEGQISAHGLAVARGRLQARLERAWQPRFRWPANERLANHLYRQRAALFTFLRRPGTEATNWRAEQALRPLVVARKVWGGNRTAAGARTQQILCSLLRTCWQQGRSPFSTLRELLCWPHPKAIPLLGSDLSPPRSLHHPLTSPRPAATLAAVA